MKQKPRVQKTDTDKSKIIVANFYTTLSEIDKTSRQMLIKMNNIATILLSNESIYWIYIRK